MSEPQGFYFHDREPPDLVDCEICGGEARLCYETNTYDVNDKSIWVLVCCTKCNHQLTCSGLPDDTNPGEKLIYDLMEQVVSQWNGKPFRFRLKFKRYIVPN